MTRHFTGWHMTAVMVGFFGIVIAVNVVMATWATTTFGGTVVDNSYVASQQFNGWLAAGAGAARARLAGARRRRRGAPCPRHRALSRRRGGDGAGAASARRGARPRAGLRRRWRPAIARARRCRRGAS